MLLYVMLSTWCERSYLLAVVLPLRDSLQEGEGFFVLFHSLALLPVSAHSIAQNKICEMLNGS